MEKKGNNDKDQKAAPQQWPAVDVSAMAMAFAPILRAAADLLETVQLFDPRMAYPALNPLQNHPILSNNSNNQQNNAIPNETTVTSKPAPATFKSVAKFQTLAVDNYRTRAEAFDNLGPNVVGVKNLKCTRQTMYCWLSTELKCNNRTCPFYCRVTSPTNDLRSYPAVVELIRDHNHVPIGWNEAYKYIIKFKEDRLSCTVPPKWDDNYRRNPGLPYAIRAYVDTSLEQDPTLRPTAAWTKTESIFGAQDLLKTSFQIRTYMKKQVENYILARKKGDELHNQKIDTYGQWKQYQKTYLLNLQAIECSNIFQPQLVFHEEDVIAFSEKLHDAGFLRGKQHKCGFRHRDLVILDDPSVVEHERYQQLLLSKTAVTGPDPRGRTMVFTSISLLSNLCWCNEQEWKVTASADGTFNVTNNDFKLLSFGFYNITDRGNRQFRPVAFCVAEGEREICALILLLNIQKAAKVLFDITIPQIRGGAVSDHTAVFVNAFKTVFLDTVLLQCYTHIIRKFMPDDKGNGSYLQYLSRTGSDARKWLKEVASVDVRSLHLCHNQKMFDKLSTLIIEAWKADGEGNMADVFAKAYVENSDYNKWRYSVTNIPGCVPDNNPIESSNLQTKGNQNLAGRIEMRRPFGTFCNIELPKLVYFNSERSVGIERPLPIMNSTIASEDKHFTRFYKVFDKSIDIHELTYRKGHYLVNGLENVGNPITEDRIGQWAKAIKGEFEKSYEHRKELVENASQFHLIIKMVHPIKKCPIFVCNCEHYFKWQWCYPSACMQHDLRFKIDMQRVLDSHRPNTKSEKKRRFMEYCLGEGEKRKMQRIRDKQNDFSNQATVEVSQTQDPVESESDSN